MSINSKYNFLLILTLCILASCRPLTYIPQVPQTPVGETGKMELTWAEIPDLAALQISYAPVDHVSFAAGANSGLIHLNIGYEAGLSLYTDLNPEVQVGLFGGYGNSVVDVDKTCRYEDGKCVPFRFGYSKLLDYEERHRTGTLNNQKYFVQPYASYIGEHVQFNFGIKNSWIKYPEFNLTDEILHHLSDTIISFSQYQQLNAHAYIAEPYFSFYGGKGSFRAFASASFQAVVLTDIPDDYFQTGRLYLSVGISKTFQIQGEK